MRIIHTSDWHLGQLFHGHDRSSEHQIFLDWLVEQLDERQPDALLIAGDVFDHANPSGKAQQKFYRFLARARKSCPDMEIVVIAGNHDSAGRLEAPESLLSEFGVQIVGQLQPDEAPERALIPLTAADGTTVALCLGIPYLRPGDLPRPEGERLSYTDGIEAAYRQHLAAALDRREPDQALIAMGHLHARGGITSEDSERKLVIGGEEAVDARIFDEALAYVALGHLHKAQKVGGQERIRYCGSPLPLSFSEIDYPHQILEIHLDGAELEKVERIRVPRPVAMLRVPREPMPLDLVLKELESLDPGSPEPGQEPWLEVRVQLKGPEPGLRHKIEDALADKPVRLLKISPSRKTTDAATDRKESDFDLEVKLGQPIDLFIRRYRDEWSEDPPSELLGLFRELEDAARQEDAE